MKLIGMCSNRAMLAVSLLYIMFALQDTAEAKWGSGGRKSSSGSRGGSRSNSHNSPSSHHTTTIHHTPASHHNPSNHGSFNSPSLSVHKPAPPPIGFNVGGHNSLSGTSHFQQMKPNIHSTYPVQSQPIGSSHLVAPQSNVHTPIQATKQVQAHSGPSQSNVHTPFQATIQNPVHSSYPVQSYHTPMVPPASVGTHQNPIYHSPNTIPAGAMYYPSAGMIPAGATFYHPPAGVAHVPVYHTPVVAPMSLPPGATFYASSASIPVGATFYQQPPRTSSGPGFGTGLVAGAIGQSVISRLGHHHHHHYDDRFVQQNNNNNNGEDRVIIINNGPAGSVQATPVGQGTTIIQTEMHTSKTVIPQNTAFLANANQNLNQLPPPVITDANVYQNPLSPQIPPIVTDDTAKVNAPKPLVAIPSNTDSVAPIPNVVDTSVNATNPIQPGGIVCMPIWVNETDPQNSSSVVEVEKIACFEAPTETAQTNKTMTVTNENDQHFLAGSSVIGNDQSQLKSSETITSIDEMNKQPVLSGGINQNYMPLDLSQPVQTTINANSQEKQQEQYQTSQQTIVIEHKKTQNSSAGEHKVHIFFVLTLLFSVNF